METIDEQFRLGASYASGHGGSPNFHQAAYWFRKAAERGHAPSQFNLAMLYEFGHGVDRDLTASEAWYERAAKLGHQRAEARLEHIRKNLNFISSLDILQNEKTVSQEKEKLTKDIYEIPKSRKIEIATESHQYDNLGSPSTSATSTVNSTPQLDLPVFHNKFDAKPEKQPQKPRQDNTNIQHKIAYYKSENDIVPWYGWYLIVLKKYAQFSGRSSRSELFLFLFVNFLVSVALGAIFVAIDPSITAKLYFFSLCGIFMFLPTLAVEARRLHDVNMSGYFLLLQILPFVGLIVLLIIFMMEGTQGANRFGEPPTAQWLNDGKRSGKVIESHELNNNFGNTQSNKGVADNAIANSQGSLGQDYTNGRDVPKDYSEAAIWYHKAADQGNADAQYKLSALYEIGQGVTQDFVQAVKWALIAKSNGDERITQKTLESLEAPLTDLEVSEAQALAREWWDHHH
jgi:TPR repeat protein